MRTMIEFIQPEFDLILLRGFSGDSGWFCGCGGGGGGCSGGCSGSCSC